MYRTPRKVGAALSLCTTLLLYSDIVHGQGWCEDPGGSCIEPCPCEGGCPSCVGAADPAFAMTDLDSAVRGRIPDKAAARLLVEAILRARSPRFASTS